MLLVRLAVLVLAALGSGVPSVLVSAQDPAASDALEGVWTGVIGRASGGAGWSWPGRSRLPRIWGASRSPCSSGDTDSARQRCVPRPSAGAGTGTPVAAVAILGPPDSAVRLAHHHDGESQRLVTWKPRAS